jgi:hypothetical protein
VFGSSESDSFVVLFLFQLVSVAQTSSGFVDAPKLALLDDDHGDARGPEGTKERTKSANVYYIE